ncbi:hypothetical protein H6P81_016950 [Aristolochia fimbriata]|uniref:F-box domain-containing protein n=1 Tax=Aristolochia fimbriata TaxID=158543 RepID=A0AAV7DY39_ARIFI|nr:hypothetical protein H6P81_016950 [Aristolochia fimbriata]
MERISRREDILREVLSLLPKKSQFRFQLVSKKWRSLLQEIQRSASHFTIPARPIDSGLLLVKGDDDWIQETKFYRLDSKGGLAPEQDLSLVPPLNHRIRLIGSCNGVIFYSMKNVAEEEEPYTFHLLNPVTKQVSNLPLLPRDEELRQIPLPVGLGLALDPGSTHQYTFIVLYGTCEENRRKFLSVATFDSLTGRWRRIPKQFVDNIYISGFPCKHLKASSVYANGRVYWINSCYSIAFCFKTERFRVFMAPPRSMLSSTGTFWEAGGRVYYGHFFEIRDLRIWVMEDETAHPAKIWRQILEVSRETLNSMIPGFCIDSHIFGAKVLAFDEYLQIVFIKSEEGHLVCYNVVEKKLTKVYPTVSGFNAAVPFVYRAFEFPACFDRVKDEKAAARLDFSATTRSGRRRRRRRRRSLVKAKVYPTVSGFNAAVPSCTKGLRGRMGDDQGESEIRETIVDVRKLKEVLEDEDQRQVVLDLDHGIIWRKERELLDFGQFKAVEGFERRYVDIMMPYFEDLDEHSSGQLQVAPSNGGGGGAGSGGGSGFYRVPPDMRRRAGIENLYDSKYINFWKINDLFEKDDDDPGDVQTRSHELRHYCYHLHSFANREGENIESLMLELYKKREEIEKSGYDHAEQQKPLTEFRNRFTGTFKRRRSRYSTLLSPSYPSFHSRHAAS